MNCSTGQLLRVNLTEGTINTESISSTIIDKYMGGRGLGTKILFDEINPRIDPLGPENKLIFVPGRFNGTPLIGAGRYMVVTKSPLTGTIACPNCGGHCGPEIKFAGWDAIVIEGQSPKPVYLTIDNDNVALKSAESLWGKGTGDTEKMIREEIGDSWLGRETQIMAIGPGGENLIKMASIMHDYHALGRNGAGAVMGSKKLKAISVRGTRGINIADSALLQKLIDDQYKKYLYPGNPGNEYWKIRHAFGTWRNLPNAQSLGEMPNYNYNEGYFPEWADFSLQKVADEYFTGKSTCYGCPYGTHKRSKVTTPGYEGCGAGPEYETLGVFGPVCGVTFLPAVFKANYICNEMGIDTIDMGVSIACAMELFENGYLPESEVGHKLNFGNYDAMIDLVKKTAVREGFGALLADGGYRMAEHFGHPELFMGVKKQAMSMHHPQGCQNFGLAYATCNGGANHTKHVVNFTNRFETKGAAEFIKDGQDFNTIHDSLGLCISVWNSPAVNKLDLPSFIEAAVGMKMDFKGLCFIGERIWNLEKLFNLRAGFTAKDDTLPRKMFEHPLTRGASKGQVVKLNEMLPEYYELRGWDKDGIPTPEKIAELGLEAEVAALSGLAKGE